MFIPQPLVALYYCSTESRCNDLPEGESSCSLPLPWKRRSPARRAMTQGGRMGMSTVSIWIASNWMKSDRNGMKIPDFVLWLVIIANAILFSYIMIFVPWMCQKLAIDTASCGLNIWTYLVAIANCVVATAAALMLIRE